MAGISEINILSELCIATKPAIVSLDKVRLETLEITTIDICFALSKIPTLSHLRELKMTPTT